MTQELNPDLLALAKENYAIYAKAFPISMTNVSEALFEIVFIEGYMRGQQKERENGNVFLNTVINSISAESV